MVNQVATDDNNNSSLTCTICFDQMKEPLRASCNHVFCKKCLLSWMKPGNRSCPMCRRDIDLLMVDTVEEIVKEGCTDFASLPAIDDVIMKRSATRQPVVFYQQEFDYMLIEDRLNLGHGKPIRMFVFLYCALSRIYRHLNDLCGPPFGFGLLVLLMASFLAGFGFVDYCTGADGRVSQEAIGDLS